LVASAKLPAFTVRPTDGNEYDFIPVFTADPTAERLPAFADFVRGDFPIDLFWYDSIITDIISR